MKCKDGKIPWLASHSHFFSVSFCPFSSPASSLAPREEQGPPFLPKLPKSSAMYYEETNKIEETMTSSRLSPVKSDKREARAPPPFFFFFSPCRRLLSFSEPSGPGPSRVGKCKSTFVLETLSGWAERSAPQEVPPNCITTPLLALPVQSSHPLFLLQVPRPGPATPRTLRSTPWSISKQ